MIIVTNRNLIEHNNGDVELCNEPNRKGTTEIRLVLADRMEDNWLFSILLDHPGKQVCSKLKEHGYNLSHKKSKSGYTSELVAQAVLQKARDEEKSILFFVHGYKNSMQSFAESCEKLEKLYNVIVVGFAWPTNAQLLDYLDDKRDARVSANALERVIARAAEYVADFNGKGVAVLRKKCAEKHPSDPEKLLRLFNRQLPKLCPVQINLLCHSMGNYLYKYTVRSSVTKGNPLLFSNIILAAADVNNEEHEKWVDKLRVRNDLYILINEDDKALLASRLKIGDQQKARLGHYLKNLCSKQAVYVDFTVLAGKKHTYYVGDCPENNPAAKAFFEKVFAGKSAFADTGAAKTLLQSKQMQHEIMKKTGGWGLSPVSL